MIKIVSASMFALLLSSSGGKPVARLCEGIAPKNDLNIPVNEVLIAAGNQMSRATFNQILDRVEKFYAPVIKTKGGTLKINRLWNDGTVNASAERDGNNYIINMYGGLARYKGMTSDGFTMVACHELGHHVGGAPKFAGAGDDWASVEGQADYFASLKCLRNVFAGDDNIAIVKGLKIDPVAASTCALSFGDPSELALCERSSAASFVLADVLRDLGQSPAIAFNTPDTSVVDTINEDHPEAQCRLDTYFAGAVCDVSVNEALSDTDAKVGACSEENKFERGFRSRCWFKPEL